MAIVLRYCDGKSTSQKLSKVFTSLSFISSACPYLQLCVNCTATTAGTDRADVSVGEAADWNKAAARCIVCWSAHRKMHQFTAAGSHDYRPARPRTRPAAPSRLNSRGISSRSTGHETPRDCQCRPHAVRDVVPPPARPPVRPSVTQPSPYGHGRLSQFAEPVSSLLLCLGRSVHAPRILLTIIENCKFDSLSTDLRFRFITSAAGGNVFISVS